MHQRRMRAVRRRALLCYLLMILCISYSVKGQISGAREDVSYAIKDSESVTKDWEKFETRLKDLVNRGIKMMLPILMDNMGGLNISSSCIKQGMQIIGGLKGLKTWAFRFLDSSGKSVDGLITGVTSALGSYDECIDTVVTNENSRKLKGEVIFTGKYCLTHVVSSLPPKKPSYKPQEIMDELRGIYEKKGTIVSKAAKYAGLQYDFPLRLGLCVPSGCSVNDINQVFAKVSNRTNIHMKAKHCEVKEELKLTPLMIFVMFMYSFVGFIVLLGTMVDVYNYYFERKPQRTWMRVLLAFSVVSNFRKLTDTSTSSKTLSCLNGIRFLTMSWIILSHSYLFSLITVVHGLEYALQMIQGFPFHVVTNGYVAVDTFFFLGGLLVCYVTTKNIKIAKRTFSFKLYIFHRLWRILPAYIFVILYIFIAEITGSGPILHAVVDPYIETCKRMWWANFLFINNYFHESDMCFTHSYYLSLDMQFYIGALIILLPLFKWPKVGISISVVFIVLSVVSTAVITAIKNLPPTFILSKPNADEYSAFSFEIYYKPYPHVAPYVIGIIVGYLLAIKNDIKIPKVVQLFGWPCSTAFCMLAVYGAYDWDQGKEPTFWEAVFYSSCHRVAWTLGVAWMVVCCATGHGGIVNYILSWKAWIPLGRLTYISYLVSPIVQLSIIASSKITYEPRHSLAVWVYFGHLAVTYGVAFAGSMLIESPCIALEKLFLFRNDEQSANKDMKTSDQELDAVEAVKSSSSRNLNHISLTPRTLNGVENTTYVYKL